MKINKPTNESKMEVEYLNYTKNINKIYEFVNKSSKSNFERNCQFLMVMLFEATGARLSEMISLLIANILQTTQGTTRCFGIFSS